MLPHQPFPACRARFVRVDKTLLCQYDGARYSMPPLYAEKALTLRAFWDHIAIADRGTTVAVHNRRPRGDISLQLGALPVLAHKPRAVRHAMVIPRSGLDIARYRDAFLQARPEAYRELVEILRLSESIGFGALRLVLQTPEQHNAYDIESIRAPHEMQREPEQPGALSRAKLGHLSDIHVAATRSADYDALTRGDGDQPS